MGASIDARDVGQHDRIGVVRFRPCHLTASADVRAVEHILGRYPLAYRITQHP